MSPAATLTAVVLPRGVTAGGGALEFAVWLSPRLTGERLLAEFPDWDRWTTQVASGATLVLDVGGVSVESAVNTAGLLPQTWKALFGRGARVATFDAPPEKTPLVVSYPVMPAMAAIKELYGSVALGGQRRDSRTLRLRLAPFRFAPQEREGGREALRTLAWDAQRRNDVFVGAAFTRGGAGTPIGADGIPLLSGGASTASIAGLADSAGTYHSMPPAPGRPDLPTTPAEWGELIDFHSALTALQSYPRLLTALGLVLDVRVPLDGLGARTGETTVRVRALDLDGGWRLEPLLVAPATACALALDADGRATRFAAAESPQRHDGILDGQMRLDEGAFSLLQVDVDGALHALATAAETARRTNDIGGAGLPALRSAGIGLIANDRALTLLRRLVRNLDIEHAPDDTVLRAEDLVRGWRLDVWSSDTGRWHSLHRRVNGYLLGDGADVARIAPAEEEGFTQPAVTQLAEDPTRPPSPSVPGGPPPQETDLYAHERVARWNGWSLSVPRPGQPLNSSADPALAVNPEPGANAPVTPFKVRRTDVHVPPGSLPRLRYGSRYRLRARAVDLAGGGAGPDAAHAAGTVLPPGGDGFPYLRWEPVPAPLLIPRTALGAARGATLDRLVIRSRNASAALDVAASDERDERHVAAPRGSFEMAELHGLLDLPSGGVDGSAARFEELAARDAATLPVDANGNLLEAGDELATFYLPDPLARDAILHWLPGTVRRTTGTAGPAGLAYARMTEAFFDEESLTRVPFSGAWPDPAPFRIVLREGTAAPAWDDANRELVVALPKGAAITVALSSGLAAHDLALLGQWLWLLERAETRRRELVAANAADPAFGERLNELAQRLGELTQTALDGAHPMLTPARVMTFVHAVQQPLRFPELAGHGGTLPGRRTRAGLAAGPPHADEPIRAWRAPGGIDAHFVGQVLAHVASTGRIDLELTWSEPVDDLAAEAPGRVVSGGHADALELNRPKLLVAPGLDERPVGRILAGVDSVWMTNAGDRVGDVVVDELAAPRHSFADTRRRIVRLVPTATSRFVDCFEPGTVVTRRGSGATVDVPASARPATPAVRNVIPTFAWERREAPGVRASVRRGRGLRVYLDRPWFSSGEGELLGVAIWPRDAAGVFRDPTPAERTAAAATITQWGLDPIWRTRAPSTGVPLLEDFPNRIDSADGRLLALPGANVAVDVAGHEVTFDADRGLWRCDIELAIPEVYAPFVRLILARYQPGALPGLELSGAVVADIAQLSPDRSVSVTTDPADRRALRVTVAGVAPEGPRRTVVRVGLQRRRDHIASDLDWVDAADAADVVQDSTPPTVDAVLWTGMVRLRQPPEQEPLRVVVSEEEQLETDPRVQLVEFGARARALEDTITLLDAARHDLLQAGAARDEPPGRRRAAAAPAGSANLRSAMERKLELAVRDRDRVADAASRAKIFGPTVSGRVVFAEIIPLSPRTSPPTEPAEVPEEEQVPPEQVPPPPPAAPPPHVGDPLDPPWKPLPGPDSGVERGALAPLDAAAAAGGASAELKLVQALLNGTGLQPPLVVDGIAGPLTATALAFFRQAQGLPPGATVDVSAWLRLLSFGGNAVIEPGIGDPVMAGPTVATVQELLNLAGAAPLLPVTGSFDDATELAIQAFRQDRGLARSAIVDAATWRALEDVPSAVAARGTLRVALALDRAAAPPVTLLGVRRGDEPPPLSDAIADPATLAGWRVEWRDADDRAIWRIALGDPFGLRLRGHATGQGTRSFVDDGEAAAGRAQLAVPDLPLAARLVLFASPPGVAGAPQPAVEIAAFDRAELQP